MLVSWVIYEPGSGPTLDFLRNKRGAESFVEDKTVALADSEPVRAEHADEASWNALLDAYKFTKMDSLDLVLLEGAQNGFFNESALKQCAQELNDQMMARRSDSSFAEAWGLYHDSFDDNQEQVLDAIYAAFDRSISRLSLTALNSTIELFKNLGRPNQAREMLETFVQKRGQDRATFDLAAYPFVETVTDPDVLTAVNKKMTTFGSKKDPKAILISISETSSWNDDDIRHLATLPVEDYYKMLKSSRGYELRHIINACLKFSNVIGSPHMTELSRRAKEALRRIGEESPINARRVRRYGLVLDPLSKDTDSKS